MNTSVNRFFATCPRGLEPALASELAGLGALDPKTVGGGVAFAGDWDLAYRCNLWSRLATRILFRLAEGPYKGEDDVYRLAHGVDWSKWFSPDMTIRVYVTAIKSPLKSLEYITLRIKDAVCDVFREAIGKRPTVDTREPDVRIHAFLTAERATLYVDTTGDPLYQRGYRQKTVDAPLKENLAAGLLAIAGWTPGQPLLDPMCGSGTLLLEAAMVVARIAPGGRRSFAFELLKNFRPKVWQDMRAAEQAGRLDLQKTSPAVPTLFGRDKDPVAFRASLANFDRAGLLPLVDLKCEDVLSAKAPGEPGLIVTNPPYGVRLSEDEVMAAFYPPLGNVLKKEFAGWTCSILSADTRLPKLIGLKPSKKTPLFNGNLECRLYEIRIVAGSNRREKPDQPA
jgi:putative N6-adenine-specific DNA methylase